MKRRSRRRLGLERLEPRQVLAAQPIITEFMAENNRALADGDGNSSDWIELYNAGDQSLDLAGWHLTDDANDLGLWTFPSKTLDPGQYLVVFASGQLSGTYVDPAGYLHTNFRLDTGGGYLALVQPDGHTIASQFANYPQQREDVAYGRAQVVTHTTLVAGGATGRLLVPTAADDAAIGSTWTGGTPAFNDTAWTAVQTGVGYEGDAPPPVQQLQNIARNKPATTNGTLWSGHNAITLTDGNRSSVLHGDGVGGNTGVREAPGFKYEVDLGSVYNFNRIEVWPRQDGCCPNRLTRYRVSVHLDDNGALGTEVWSADIRTNGSFPPAGPTPPDTLGASLDPDGSFSGQWVRILSLENPVPEYALQVGELEVYSLVDVPLDQINQALAKPISASGPLYPNFPNPGLLTDGNRATFTHPATPVTSFHYTIDLGTTQSLDRINVVNRGDGCCPERLTNYRVAVHADDDGEFGPAVWSADIRADGTNSGSAGVDVVTAALDPAGQFEGRFIRIEKPDTGTSEYWPQIAEVEVFSPTGYLNAIATDIEASMKDTSASAYLRVPFSVADSSLYDALTFRIKDDDGFVAYLNGVEIARRNSPAGAPAYNAAATAKHFAAAFSEYTAPASALRTGNNVLAVHGLNFAASDDDFLIVPELSARSIATATTGYLVSSTPGGPNGTSVAGFVSDTRFEGDPLVFHERGFYDAPFDVTLTTTTPGATIVYTTDGSIPTLEHGSQIPPAGTNSPPSGTVHVATTTVLRVAAFKSGFQPTNIDTQTYLFLDDVIHQPANPPSLPTTWSGGFAADYQMDPDVVNNPAYSDEIIAGLKSIPTMSLVFDPDDLWSATDGIYYYPERLGLAYERPVSIEVINPDGTTMFQEDAGARIWGTGWRPHSSTPKHAFQLKFKQIYGDTKLRHPLFPDAPVHEYDDIILRAQGSRSWLDFRTGALERDATQYIHDTWARDTARDMGKNEGHATLVHLYLNGLYWGLYNPVERPTGNYGEVNYGGDNDDYDVISYRVGQAVTANEGDLVAWNQVQALSNQGPANPAVYAQLQSMVDFDNLIDYMLIHQYATNHDGPSNIAGYGSGNNMRLLRKREPGGQFRFYVWDMEYTFWNANENSNINDVDFANTAGHLFTKLRENPEFRQRFADRAVMHLTGDGALTPAKAAARWQARADEIYTAIIGESARWGDYRRPTQPYTRDVEWAAELNRLKTQYFPQRTGILIGQLKAAGLFPDTPAPDFNQDGGIIEPGFNLEMTVTAPPTLINTAVVTQGSPVRALIPTSNALGQTWTQGGFSDFTGWVTGTSGVGYDKPGTGLDYGPLIGTNIIVPPPPATPAGNQAISVFTRFEFNLAGTNLADVTALTLRMKYDDGFVAYLNGTEVVRCLAPLSPGTCTIAAGPTTPPAYNAPAQGPFRTDLASNVFQDFNITAFKNLLGPGDNVLAIHGMNATATSSDLLVLPELVVSVPDPGGPAGVPVWYTLDGSDPRLPGGTISPTALLYQGPVTINASTPIAARALQSSQWSGLSSAQFTVQLPLRITEVMYHPANQTLEELARTPGGNVFYDDDDYEFIELLNVGSQSVDLTGVKFTGGIEFTFAAETLAPGEYGVIVRNQAAFENRYGTGRRILGVYGGTPEDFGLQNSGEQMVLVDAGNGAIHDFTYDDAGSWPADADGDGPSLVIIAASGNSSDWADPLRWRASFQPNGSPAETDRMPGDVNEDLRVDAADLAILQINLGTVGGAARGDGDLDGDGAVSRSDARRVAQNFGRSYPPPAPAPSPAAPRAVIALANPSRTAAIDTALSTLRIKASRSRPIQSPPADSPITAPRSLATMRTRRPH